ncbi:hypothetical protein [Novosphingobium terrae]|uniref:hypothetical protein n=1 Tax=Novosphingobium terrae TaxID=2726189 RepID=UPI00198230AE|nr:hypothetical protein [Novosphingobium terrae]
MKLYFSVVAIVLMSATASMTKEPMPTASELAEALAKQTKKPVSPAGVRPMKCEGFAEEPTEFECRWAQKVGEKWLRYSTYFAVEQNGWAVIDWPPSKLK